ncbi:MAG: class I SAM-dependent methyltransferase [Alphaproteobacteria bacterium]
MSRLDSAIRRLEAQRACLDFVCGAVAAVPGVVLEAGLGNGRTYDHLRSRLPGREIFVFDRQVDAHPDCIPDAAHLFLGDLFDRLPDAIARLGRTAALIHSDIGTGEPERNARVAAALAPLYAKLLVGGGLLASDQAMPAEAWAEIPLPPGVPPGRYFLYRAKG